MDPIIVPAAPRSAYNPNRRVSDLLESQLKHFQHVHLTRSDLNITPALARDIYTEAGAARYIAAITNALRGTAKPTGIAAVPAIKPVKKSVPLALAAAAAPTKTSPSPTPAKTAVRKSAKKTAKKAAKKAVKKSARRKP